MGDIDQVKKMLTIIHKLQESTKENPVIQSEIRKTLETIGELMKNSHLALTKSCIQDIENDMTRTDEEKEFLIKQLNVEKAKMMGLFA